MEVVSEDFTTQGAWVRWGELGKRGDILVTLLGDPRPHRGRWCPESSGVPSVADFFFPLFIHSVTFSEPAPEAPAQAWVGRDSGSQSLLSGRSQPREGHRGSPTQTQEGPQRPKSRLTPRAAGFCPRTSHDSELPVTISQEWTADNTGTRHWATCPCPQATTHTQEILQRPAPGQDTLKRNPLVQDLCVCSSVLAPPERNESTGSPGTWGQPAEWRGDLTGQAGEEHARRET